MAEGQGESSADVPAPPPALVELERTVNFILESRDWILAEHWVYARTTDQVNRPGFSGDLFS
jgi:hypothetical protein